MNPILEIFSQGEEIVSGQVVDTNAAWLSQQAVELGFTVSRHTALGDKLPELMTLLQEIALRADCCICTGGLGPTTDDLTSEAVAAAFHLPLELNAEALAQIERYFVSRNKPMPAPNQKQAMLPQGAEWIENHWGTAPGFILQQGRCCFVFLPGVPYEMKNMYTEKVQPVLARRFLFRPGRIVTFKTFGMGESAIQECLCGIEMPAEVQVGYCATAQEVQVKLQFPYGYEAQAMTDLVSKLADKLGEIVFSIDGMGHYQGDLSEVVDKLMRQGQYTLAIQEPASCGVLCSLCAAYDWLLSAGFEQAQLKTGQELVQQNNEALLSSSVQAIAFALQQQTGADFALVQLNTGDYEAWHDTLKPVVLYNALLTGRDFIQETHTLSGSLKRKQNRAALLSLDLLRRYLQGRCVAVSEMERG